LKRATPEWLLKLGSNVSLVLLLILPFVISGGDFPGWQALLPASAAFLIILGGQTGWAGKILSHPKLVYVGLISYPLYLWLWEILVMLKLSEPSPSRLLRLAVLSVSFLLAHLTYRYIEKPISSRPVSSRLILVLVSLMFLILVVSFSSFRWGFLVRDMTQLRAALSKEPDIQLAYRWKTCFLDSRTQIADSFDTSCMPEVQAGEHSILIWGDSLAAQLYPGLNDVSHIYKLSVAQRTAGSCAPGLEPDLSYNGNYDAINAATRSYIEMNRPYAVV